MKDTRRGRKSPKRGPRARPSARRRRPRVTTLVTETETLGRETLEREVRVRTLAGLYDACRDAPASRVMRVTIRGPKGEVRLNFASFIRQP